MSHKRRSVLETKIQRDIEAALGAERDLILLKNSNGTARFINETDGKEFFVPYGLGVGSPDLVGILRVAIGGGVVGVWLCLEIKTPEGELDAEQEKCHAIWRRFGALIYVVRSVDEARVALSSARAETRRAA